jgi:dynein heavy chain 2
MEVGMETLIAVVDKGIAVFSRENRGLHVVITPEVLENVAFMDRILSFPCSSLVLAGRAGIGRRTALSIVSALHQARIVTLKVGRNYSVKSFKNDLKAVS